MLPSGTFPKIYCAENGKKNVAHLLILFMLLLFYICILVRFINKVSLSVVVEIYKLINQFRKSYVVFLWGGHFLMWSLHIVLLYWFSFGFISPQNILLDTICPQV